MYLQQLNRAWSIVRKDIRIYYLKGPVMIFGIIFPVFLFLVFYYRPGPDVNFCDARTLRNGGVLYLHRYITRRNTLGNSGQDTGKTDVLPGNHSYHHPR